MTRNALLAAMLWLGACSSSGSSPTQIVVTVDSDLRVPAQMDRVTIDVADHGTAPEANADLTTQKLPRSIGLVHDQGPLGPFTVRAQGFLGSKRVIEKQVMTSFVKGKTIELAVELDRACMAVFCDAGQTCLGGSCQDIPTLGGKSDAGVTSEGGADSGGTSGAEAGATNVGNDGGATDSGADPGDPPECKIGLPGAFDTYERSKAFVVSGSCTDAESGKLTVGLTWSSDREGPVGTGAAASVTLMSEGTHELELCAPDPADARVVGCATVSIAVATDVQPRVHIDSVQQASLSVLPFRSNQPIDYLGTGTGAGVALTWIDSIHGALGTGTSVSLAQPEVGKHKVTLLGTDRNQATRDDRYEYTVLDPDHDAMIEAYASVNSGIAGSGSRPDVTSLGIDPAGRVYAAANGKLFVFAAGQADLAAAIAIDAPPLLGAVQDVFVDGEHSLAYVATTAGLTVCDYIAITGVGNGCNTYTGVNFPSDNVRSVVRLAGNNKSYTLIGTSLGALALKDVAGSSQGSKVDGLDDVAVNAMAVAGSTVWSATANGLYRHIPGAGKATRINTAQGGPLNPLTSLAVASNGTTIWVGSGTGLHRYVGGMPGVWTSFKAEDGLVSNAVNAVAVSRPTINGVAREVIWVATANGVTRFDPSIPSFTTFSIADGLPSNTVHDVVVLANGTKVFATSAGVARFTGP